jgi:hypothetical protein
VDSRPTLRFWKMVCVKHCSTHCSGPTCVFPLLLPTLALHCSSASDSWLQHVIRLHGEWIGGGRTIDRDVGMGIGEPRLTIPVICFNAVPMRAVGEQAWCRACTRRLLGAEDAWLPVTPPTTSTSLGGITTLQDNNKQKQ